ncbi:MAG: aminopeptidase N, partial [Myxococcota bacterium]
WSLTRRLDPPGATVTIMTEGTDWDLRTELLVQSGDSARTIPIRLTEPKHVITLDGPIDSVVLDPNYALLTPIEPKLSTGDLTRWLTSNVAVPRRIEAAERLANIGSTPAVAALVEALSSDGFWGFRKEIARVLGGLGTPDARSALMAELEVCKHPKVRRGIVASLSTLTGCDDVGRALAEIVRRGDPSYFVDAEAATAVGRVGLPDALEVLNIALGRESFNDVVRCGALIGLGWLRSDEAIDRLIEHAEPEHDELVRVAAVTALGRAGRDEPEIRPRVLDVFHGFRAETGLRFRLALIGALETVSAVEALPTLRALATSGGDARIRRRALEAQRNVRSGVGLGEVRGELDRLKASHGRLLERVEKMHTKGEPGGP